MVAETTQTASLPDGRSLELLLQGPNDGEPVFYLHGAPGSLHDQSQHSQLYHELGIRMISLNRPGTGTTTFLPEWNHVTFSSDLLLLCEQLGIEQATIIGFSAGGLYGCAFAYHNPERVKRLALLSSVGPFDIPLLDKARTESAKAFHDAARDAPDVLLEQFSGIKTAEALLALVDSIVAPEDRPIFANPEIHTQVLAAYSDVLLQGLDKLIHEIANINRPWGFSLNDIGCETQLWHGTADQNVPIECTQYLAEQIPSATATYLEEAGHYYSLSQWGELLRKITA